MMPRPPEKALDGGEVGQSTVVHGAPRRRVRRDDAATARGLDLGLDRLDLDRLDLGLDRLHLDRLRVDSDSTASASTASTGPRPPSASTGSGRSTGLDRPSRTRSGSAVTGRLGRLRPPGPPTGGAPRGGPHPARPARVGGRRLRDRPPSRPRPHCGPDGPAARLPDQPRPGGPPVDSGAYVDSDEGPPCRGGQEAQGAHHPGARHQRLRARDRGPVRRRPPAQDGRVPGALDRAKALDPADGVDDALNDILLEAFAVTREAAAAPSASATTTSSSWAGPPSTSGGSRR